MREALTIGAVATALFMLPCSSRAQDDPSFIVPGHEAFLRLLDLDRPGLEAVRAALDAGDVEQAKREYARHFRAMRLDTPLLADWPQVRRNPAYDTSRADGLLAGDFWDGYSEYQVPETGLDWHGSPLSCVTRFPVLGTLRQAIHHTREPGYVRFTADHILQYMQAYPIEDFVGRSTDDGWTSHTTVARPWYWCMIPQRLTEMSETLNLIRHYPQVTDDELMDMLLRLYQETGFLRTEIKRWVDRRHNGGGAMILGMARACAVLEDFPASHEWMDHNASLAVQYMDEAFYPDGMCVELTTAYSGSVSLLAQQMADALREQAAIQARRDHLAALVECMVALSDPTGWVPSFGDLYAGHIRRYVHPPLAEWLGLDWALTVARGGEGPAPPFTVWPRPGGEQWSGYYTMRSGWEPDANYCAIDGGPWGTTHQHADRLSFVITAQGAKFIIDPSSTRYASNAPGAFISVQRAGFLHNSITVDGVDQFRSEGTVNETTEPLANRWEHGDDYTLFVSDFSFRPVKPVTWERRLLFVEGRYWLLQDVVRGDLEAADLEQNFQFEADITIEFQDDMTVATAPNGARLLLVPLEGGLRPTLTVGDTTPGTTYWPSGKPTQVLAHANGQDQKHGRGWTGRSGDRLIPAPAVTYVGRAEFPASLTVAIIPLGPGEDLADRPLITRSRDEADTLWQLPVADGHRGFRASVDECAVE